MPGWLLLAGAIGVELVGTMALRQASQAPSWWAYTLVAVGYVSAFVLLYFTLRYMNICIAYALWSGIGTAGAAIGGWLLFTERLSLTAIIGIGIIIMGVVVVNLG